jgi:hypothetical protein
METRSVPVSEAWLIRGHARHGLMGHGTCLIYRWLVVRTCSSAGRENELQNAGERLVGGRLYPSWIALEHSLLAAEMWYVVSVHKCPTAMLWEVRVRR